jgi:hypothetical protein
MQYYLKYLRNFKMRSILIIIILLAFATNVKTQSVLEISAGASITITSGADICADSIIGNIQGEGTICGGVNSIDSGTEGESPKVFALDQNYPNPFNPSTKISWQSPVSGHQALKIYDVLGNEVETLVNEEKPAGNYEVDFNATQLSSGIYFYRLQAGYYNASRKMILIK